MTNEFLVLMDQVLREGLEIIDALEDTELLLGDE
jgi:hypothetical protein